MPIIAYETWDPRPATRVLIKHAQAIVKEYAAQGFSLTLRQLYYQFVSRDLIPNKQAEYDRLGSIVSRARRAGLIDWDAIVDRTRELRSLSEWESPDSIIAAVANQYRVEAWKDQPYYVEVWFEKDALMGVFERPANRWRLPFFSCRGYTSDSEVWSAAQRFRRIARKAQGGRRCLVLHFGDHDPSGLDMTRDIEDRLRLFGASDTEVKRIALTHDQVLQYNPPPNPAKETDTRFAAYRTEYGDESWELDALNPTVLAELVDREVSLVLDQRKWDVAMKREKDEKRELSNISENYNDVVDWLRNWGK